MFFREEYYLKKIWSIRLYFHEKFGTDLSVNGYHMPLYRNGSSGQDIVTFKNQGNYRKRKSSFVHRT